MSDLTFAIEGVETPAYAATPQFAFKLRVTNDREEERIHTVMLRAQIQIEATRRRYDAQEQERLLDLFGEPDRWSTTLRSMLWTHAAATVPSFSGRTVVDLPVPCTYDFNVAATKYFYALDDGEIPLTFLFSGTVFYANAEGALQAGQISWEREAAFRLPVRAWKQMMDVYYPNSAWLRLQRDIFDRLYHYKVRHGLPTWEEAIASLLPVAEAVEP